jgi:Holliday junction resolvase RusA-like endonuclease|tara:strand:+ start:86 stop:514 length:429 start_codon:yes stop_codon:yes gene_type:complete
MSFMITFKVDADPVGKQRARYAKRGNFVQTYTPDKTRNYETLIKAAAIEAMGASEPLETPINLYLYIRAPIPKSLSKKRLEACLNGLEKPIKKPDASNVLKSVEDAMNGVVYKDDSQIVNIHVTKVYCSVSGIDVCVKECLD